MKDSCAVSSEELIAELEHLQQMKIKVDRRKLQLKLLNLQKQLKIAKEIDNLYREAEVEQKTDRVVRCLGDHLERGIQEDESSGELTRQSPYVQRSRSFDRSRSVDFDSLHAKCFPRSDSSSK
jgi:hypothetical protein